MKASTPRYFIFGATLGLLAALLVIYVGREAPEDPSPVAREVPAPVAVEETPEIAPEPDLTIERVPEMVDPPRREDAPEVTRPVDPEAPAHAAAAFARWLEQEPPTGTEARAQWLKEGIAVAEERAPLMANWIVEDPERALAWGVSPRLFRSLPEEIQALVERPLATEGFYGVLAICGHGPEDEHISSCEILHEVVTNFGTFDAEAFRASIYGMRNMRLTEENASLFGIVMNDHIALHEDDVVIVDDGPRFGAERFVVHYKGEEHTAATLEAAEAIRAELVKLEISN